MARTQTCDASPAARSSSFDFAACAIRQINAMQNSKQTTLSTALPLPLMYARKEWKSTMPSANSFSTSVSVQPQKRTSSAVASSGSPRGGIAEMKMMYSTRKVSPPRRFSMPFTYGVWRMDGS